MAFSKHEILTHSYQPLRNHLPTHTEYFLKTEEVPGIHATQKALLIYRKDAQLIVRSEEALSGSSEPPGLPLEGLRGLSRS